MTKQQTEALRDAVQHAGRNAVARKGEVVLHASDWLRIQDALATPSLERREAMPSIADIAEDTLRGGNPADGECGSVQHDLHLCRDCTRKADSIGAEDYEPTRQEILEATGAL